MPTDIRNVSCVIKNSVGAKTRQDLYARVDGKVLGVMRGGDLSYAFFVSSALALFRLIEKPHATVIGTILDMERSGWRRIKEPKTGSVLIWESIIKTISGEMHKHIGFYVGGGKTNDPKQLKKPHAHRRPLHNARYILDSIRP